MKFILCLKNNQKHDLDMTKYQENFSFHNKENIRMHGGFSKYIIY